MSKEISKNVRKLLAGVEHASDSKLAEKRQVRVIAASGRADRVGDIVKIDGIKLDNYKKNPVVLYGHDHYSLPVAKAVEMGVVNGRLEMVFEFADAETYAFADTVYKLLTKGFLKGVSIGARVLEAEWIRDDDERIVGRQYNSLELLEVSVVAIPADSKALVTAVKSGSVSEEEIAEVMAKSFDLPLDNDMENHVEPNTEGSSPVPDEEDTLMKERIAELEKRLMAIEALIKASHEVQATQKSALDGVVEAMALLKGQAATSQKPDMAAISAAFDKLPGQSGAIAKQMLGMLDGMLNRVK